MSGDEVSTPANTFSAQERYERANARHELRLAESHDARRELAEVELAADRAARFAAHRAERERRVAAEERQAEQVQADALAALTTPRGARSSCSRRIATGTEDDRDRDHDRRRPGRPAHPEPRRQPAGRRHRARPGRRGRRGRAGGRPVPGAGAGRGDPDHRHGAGGGLFDGSLTAAELAARAAAPQLDPQQAAELLSAVERQAERRGRHAAEDAADALPLTWAADALAGPWAAWDTASRTLAGLLERHGVNHTDTGAMLAAPASVINAWRKATATARACLDTTAAVAVVEGDVEHGLTHNYQAHEDWSPRW